MGTIKLVRPVAKYDEQIMAYKAAFEIREEMNAGCGDLMICDTAKAWRETVYACEEEGTCPSNKVPATIYLAVTPEDELVGMIDLRHHINHQILSTWGGHIGYAVHPEKRRQGYAKEMLRLALQAYGTKGIEKVLITCEVWNEASAHVIEANDGILEKVIEIGDRCYKRYWIEVPDTSSKRHAI